MTQLEQPAGVVVKAYDFALWLLPKVEKFGRSYRFTLGDRLVTHGLDLLLVLVGTGPGATGSEFFLGVNTGRAFQRGEMAN